MGKIEMQFTILNPHKMPLRILIYVASLAGRMGANINSFELEARTSRRSSPYYGAERLCGEARFDDDTQELIIEFWMERSGWFRRTKKIDPMVTTRATADSLLDETGVDQTADYVGKIFAKERRLV